MFAIEDPQLVLPDRVALDTSFLVEALLETQPHHHSCAGFLARLVETRVPLVTSELVAVELAEAVCAIAIAQRWGRRWRQHRTDGRARRPARRLLAELQARLDQATAPTDHLTVPIGIVTTDATELMLAYGLASYDAVHAATAIAAGADSIATTDTSFALLPASMLTVYTDRTRLTNCRSKRPTR